MKVEAKLQINAPVERVFEVFTDFHNLEQNVSGITKIELLEKDGQPEVGMKWRETRIMFGKQATEEMWITAINSNQNYAVEAESHGMHYRSTYTFIDQGSSTLVKIEFSGKPLTLTAKLASIIGILFTSSLKKALMSDMNDLKKIAESN